MYNIRSMQDRLAQSLAKQRVLMWLLNFFGATALTLATVGLYGVLSFGVDTRDPVAFVVAIAIVLCVALAARLLPARSAASVDPMEALGQD